MIDEAHHSRATTYQKLIEQYPDTIVLGLCESESIVMSKQKDNFTESYVQIRRAMLESDAYKSLGKVEMKILARIEIELMRHAGKDNGRLICPYDDFKDYGIRRKSIASGLRNLSTVGLLDITRRGRRSSRCNPHNYRLTYLHSYDENGNKIGPTDEWKKYRARPRKRRSAQNTRGENAPCSGGESAPWSGGKNATVRNQNSRGENDPAFYNLPIYLAEAELGAEAASEAKPAWSTPVIEELIGVKPEEILAEFGYGHNGGPKLDDGLDIPEFLRRIA